MNNKLPLKRITSIDAFRGITILVMVFVNELSGIRDIPAWAKHMPAKADDMSFVDIVFPAFLFIAGMALPFAIAKRLANNPDRKKLWEHILWRVAGLLCFGFFMVNTEGGGPHHMILPIAWWALLFYLFAILVWKVYYKISPKQVRIIRGIGLAGLLLLALIYRGGKDGDHFMTPKWWGILGLIGWAYLFSSLFYQLSSGRFGMLLLFILLCTGLFALTYYYDWNDYPAKNATHIAVMLCGIATSILLFDQNRKASVEKRMWQVVAFAAVLFIAAFSLRPAYGISKIYATPSWGFFCAGICCVLYLVFYWLIDLKGKSQWTGFIRPAAENPLLTYLIPDIIFMLCLGLHFHLFPGKWAYGIPGTIWSACFAIIVLYIAKWLTKSNLRLQL